jgi:hypothetical protein
LSVFLWPIPWTTVAPKGSVFDVLYTVYKVLVQHNLQLTILAIPNLILTLFLHFNTFYCILHSYKFLFVCLSLSFFLDSCLGHIHRLSRSSRSICAFCLQLTREWSSYAFPLSLVFCL